MWRFSVEFFYENSMSNSIALRILQRAESMKQKDDGSVSLNDTTTQTNIFGCKENGKRSEDEALLANISNKYGLPFSLNHSQNNGDVDPSARNGKFSALFNNDNTDKNNDNGSAKPTSASERFRRAGMKARLARRMEKIVEDRMTVKQIFNRYVQNSTLHGFRFIFMKTFLVRRAAWVLLTCTMAAIFFMELRNSIELYFDYPFTTTSTIEYVPSLKFPAISICNLNHFQASKVNNSKLKRLYDAGKLPFDVSWTEPRYNIAGKETCENFEIILSKCWQFISRL